MTRERLCAVYQLYGDLVFQVVYKRLCDVDKSKDVCSRVFLRLGIREALDWDDKLLKSWLLVAADCMAAEVTKAEGIS